MTQRPRDGVFDVGIARTIAAQLRRPRGWLGRLTGLYMTRNNARVNAWTVSLLAVSPEDHVLEVGFGSGAAIGQVAQRLSGGKVCGIDYSETMVRLALKRNAAAVREGRVEIHHGDISALPYEDDSFDKAYAIHSIYFWPDPLAALGEMRRVLKPGGLAAISILSRDDMLKMGPRLPDFILYSGKELVDLFEHAGFIDVRLEEYPDKPGLCVIGLNEPGTSNRFTVRENER